MLESTLRTKADELAPLTEPSLSAPAVSRNPYQVIRTESNMMLMDGVIGSMGEAYQLLNETHHDQLVVVVERTEKMLIQLNATMSFEVEGAFAREVGELCSHVTEQLKQLLHRPNKVLLDRCSNIMNQLAEIWEQGMLRHLMRALDDEATGLDYGLHWGESPVAEAALLH